MGKFLILLIYILKLVNKKNIKYKKIIYSMEVANRNWQLEKIKWKWSSESRPMGNKALFSFFQYCVIF